jgi:hypothetical protein
MPKVSLGRLAGELFALALAVVKRGRSLGQRSTLRQPNERPTSAGGGGGREAGSMKPGGVAPCHSPNRTARIETAKSLHDACGERRLRSQCRC